MRKRIRVSDRSPRHRRGAVFVVAAPAFAADDRAGEADFTNEAAQAVLREAREGRRHRVDDCQKAPSPLLPGEERDHLGLGRVPRAARRDVEVRRAGREEHGAGTRGPHPQRPRGRREGARPRPRRRRRSTSRRSPTRSNEAGRIIEEARQAAEQVRRDLIARAEAEANEIRARAQADIANQRSQAMAQLRTDVASLSIDLAGRIVERNLDSDTQPPARRQLHRPGREQLTDGRPHRRLRAGAARDRAAEDHLTRSKTSCSASRGSSKATTTCAWRSSNPGLPADRRAGDRRRAAREPVAADDARDRGVHRRCGPRSRPARDRRPVRRARGAEP